MDAIGDWKNFQNVTNSIHKMREEIKSNKAKTPEPDCFPEELLRITLRKDGREHSPKLPNN